MSLITLKFNDPKNLGKKEIHERIANQVHRQLNTLQLKGMIGEDHPISPNDILFWIEDFCVNKKFLNRLDKNRRDYWLFLDRLYSTIMTNYIRKDELTKDTDDKGIKNPYYYPGLVYISGIGYIITNSQEIINKYEDQREECLEGQKLHLNQKCYDASEFVKMLPDIQKKHLLDDKDREIT